MTKKIIQIIIISLLIIGSFMGGWYGKTRSYEQYDQNIINGSEDFVTKLNVNDYSGAYQLSSGAIKSRFTTESAFTEAIKKDLGDNTLGAFILYKGDTQSIIRYAVEDKDGKVIGELAVSVDKIDSKWTVTNYSYTKF